MIAYYVHHVGAGHLHRVRTLAAALDEPVGVLSSLPRPQDWSGAWEHLPDDAASDEAPVDLATADVTAGGRLHWVPRHHPGLRGRAALVSAFLERHRPRLLVSDTSVEVTLLARLHGVPVVTVVLPGRRDDPAHRLGLDVSDELVGFWPSGVRGMLPGLPDAVHDRVRPLGALSRFEPTDRRPPGERRAVVLLGAGGDALGADDLDRAARQLPGWSWRLLGGRHGTWTADPWSELLAADVVVTHAGQNALAEVAAARRPAVVLPQARPHDEQRTTGAALRAGPWPALVPQDGADAGWWHLVPRAAGLDGGRWSGWCDGGAAGRMADLLAAVPAR